MAGRIRILRVIARMNIGGPAPHNPPRGGPRARARARADRPGRAGHHAPHAAGQGRGPAPADGLTRPQPRVDPGDEDIAREHPHRDDVGRLQHDALQRLLRPHVRAELVQVHAEVRHPAPAVEVAGDIHEDHVEDDPGEAHAHERHHGRRGGRQGVPDQAGALAHALGAGGHQVLRLGRVAQRHRGSCESRPGPAARRRSRSPSRSLGRTRADGPRGGSNRRCRRRTAAGGCPGSGRTRPAPCTQSGRRAR